MKITLKLMQIICILTTAQLRTRSIMTAHAEDGMVAANSRILRRRNLQGGGGGGHGFHGGQGGGHGFHGGQSHSGDSGGGGHGFHGGQGHSGGYGYGGGRQAEMAVIHNLVSVRDDINRSIVVDESTGVHQMVTTSKSNNTVVAGLIQEHVKQMMRLIENGERIRQRDPLFVDLFNHKNEIITTYEDRDFGVFVQQEGTTPCGRNLITNHSAAVTGFINTGDIYSNHEAVEECRD